MDSQRLFSVFAKELGLVSVSDAGQVRSGDVFHHMVDAGYTTAREFLDNLPSAALLDAFITSVVEADLDSPTADRLRRLQKRASRLLKADRSFAKACPSGPSSRPLIARSSTFGFERTVPKDVPGRDTGGRPAAGKPVDRRSFRAALQRRRSELLSGDAAEKVAASAPSLIFHVRRAAGRRLLQAAATEGRFDGALPGLESLSWLEASLASSAPPVGSAEAELTALEEQLLELSRNASAALARPAGQAVSSPSACGHASAGSSADRLSAASRLLCAYRPTMLARRTRQLHERCQRLYNDLAKLLGEAPMPLSDELSCLSIQPGSGSEDDVGTWTQKVELSQEQWRAVQCPTSLFLQGRSGTGKTLVLMRRLLLRRSELERTSAEVPSQLFVTKSSMLRDEVASQLAKEGCKPTQPRWPPRGLLCVTWDELVRLIVANCRRDSRGPIVPKSGAAINYARFLSHYWPRLRPRARQLPPLLVWAEFHNRLRSFNSEWASSGLSLKEYLKEELAAVGIRLDLEDLHVVHSLFLEYTRLKRSARELDDTDIAMLVRSYALTSCLHGLYVDEAQDFSPTELSVLLSLCKDPYGVTVAGDTCQTINPGSAFNFEDIAEAFVRYGGISLAGNAAEAFRLQARERQLLQLRYNYRCPSGVAALAGSVSQLLLQRFPRCADRIDEATMHPSSVLPVFVEMPGTRPSSCIQGEGARRLRVPPTAKAAILVRSDDARQRLRDDGITATVLTVAEAKGLEFDLIVLCGLLTDSPDSTLLGRLADEHSEETKLAAYAASVQEVLCAGGAVAHMSNQEHRRLCRIILAIPELKSLYVAVTRARAGCVVLECKSDPAVWACILKRWEGLVEHWSGTRSYLLETSSVTGASMIVAAEAEPETPKVKAPATLDEMNQWIDRELATREGRMHKKAKAALTKERSRLRKGGDMNEQFYANFEESFGIRQGLEEQSSPSNVFKEPLPSFVPVLEKRFGIADMAAPPSPAKLGFQMLSHAADNLRERWHVFIEAGQALQEAIRAADVTFAAGLLLRRHQREPLRPGESQESRAASLISAVFRGLRQRKRLRAELGESRADCLHASARHAASTRHLCIAFRRQIATVLREASRASSWRGGSTLAHIRSLQLWSMIFAFLKPTRDEDVRNAVFLTAELVREHAQSHTHLVRGSVLAHAWHLLCQSRYDHVAREREENLQQTLCAAAVASNRAAPAEGMLQEARTHVEELLELTAARAARCKEAASAFRAVQQWQLAAEAFDEAAAANGLVPELLASLRLQGASACSKATPGVVAASKAAQAHAARAAHCWLIVAKQASCAGPGGQDALRSAAASFARAGQPLDAATCLARAGHLRTALQHLVGVNVSASLPLGLLFAALLGELGCTRAPL